MTANNDIIKHTTPGEELYLVHLRRKRDEDDDHDELPHKRRSASIGEELWEVHRRRSQGMEDDLDRDIEEARTSDKRDTQKNVATVLKKKAAAPQCRYNLRSMDRKKA